MVVFFCFQVRFSLTKKKQTIKTIPSGFPRITFSGRPKVKISESRKFNDCQIHANI